MNFQSYRDVANAPPEFEGPVSTLYSVAAGLKANLLLHAHGIGARTRVVFFDSSPNALELRRLMLREWDGTDFPAFVRYALERLEIPCQGEHAATSDLPNEGESERQWRDAPDQWGGAPAFQKHWDAYRRLAHGFVCCDILTEPQKLFNWMTNELNAIVWFGNAFRAALKSSYENWIEGLASRCPNAILYGADPDNNRVHGVRAGAYAIQYEARGGEGPHLALFSRPSRTVAPSAPIRDGRPNKSGSES